MALLQHLLSLLFTHKALDQKPPSTYHLPVLREKTRSVRVSN